MRSIIAVLALAFAVTAHAGKIEADEIIDLGGVQDQNYGAQAVNKHGDVGARFSPFAVK